MFVKSLLSGVFILFTHIANSQTIDQSKSKVLFEIDNLSIRTVEGTLTGLRGEINFQETDLSKSYFNVCVDANSINTENTKRDQHLKKEDFLQTNLFPSICFKSKAIQKTDTSYWVDGELSLHGITQPISFPFTYTSKLFNASFDIKRLDFGIGEDYGNFMVGEKISINIFCYIK